MLNLSETSFCTVYWAVLHPDWRNGNAWSLPPRIRVRYADLLDALLPFGHMPTWYVPVCSRVLHNVISQGGKVTPFCLYCAIRLTKGVNEEVSIIDSVVVPLGNWMLSFAYGVM